MEKILHQLIVVYPIIYKVFYIPGGAGFLPSTVCLKKREERLHLDSAGASTTCKILPLDIRTSNPGTVALALKSYGGHRGGGHPSSHRSLLNRRGQNFNTMNSYSTQIQSIPLITGSFVGSDLNWTAGLTWFEDMFTTFFNHLLYVKKESVRENVAECGVKVHDFRKWYQRKNIVKWRLPPHPQRIQLGSVRETTCLSYWICPWSLYLDRWIKHNSTISTFCTASIQSEYERFHQIAGSFFASVNNPCTRQKFNTFRVDDNDESQRAWFTGLASRTKPSVETPGS